MIVDYIALCEKLTIVANHAIHPASLPDLRRLDRVGGSCATAAHRAAVRPVRARWRRNTSDSGVPAAIVRLRAVAVSTFRLPAAAPMTGPPPCSARICPWGHEWTVYGTRDRPVRDSTSTILSAHTVPYASRASHRSRIAAGSGCGQLRRGRTGACPTRERSSSVRLADRRRAASRAVRASRRVRRGDHASHEDTQHHRSRDDHASHQSRRGTCRGTPRASLVYRFGARLDPQSAR